MLGYLHLKKFLRLDEVLVKVFGFRGKDHVSKRTEAIALNPQPKSLDSSRT